MISEFLVAYITIVASDWPRIFFTPKVFLFSIVLTVGALLIISCVQVAVSFFCDFLTLFNGYKKKRKIVKDEKKLYGTIWSHTPSASGSYGRQAGQQSDEIVVDFEIFKILYRSHR